MGQEQPTPFVASLQTSTGYLLYRVGAESRRRWTQMLADLSLTTHQYGVLLALDSVGAASQRELGLLLGIDPRNLVAVLDALQRRDLLVRRTDPADRRRRSVSLTPDGVRVAGELQRTGEALERDLVARLDPGERETLHELLRKLLPPRA